MRAFYFFFSHLFLFFSSFHFFWYDTKADVCENVAELRGNFEHAFAYFQLIQPLQRSATFLIPTGRYTPIPLFSGSSVTLPEFRSVPVSFLFNLISINRFLVFASLKVAATNPSTVTCSGTTPHDLLDRLLILVFSSTEKEI